MPCFPARAMPLEEANALVTSLLEDELEPSKRARLVALRLELGWPHALEVAPHHLDELRRSEQLAARARGSRAWLGTASGLALVWNAGGVLFWAPMVVGDSTLVIFLAAFVLGLGHAAAALVQAHRAAPPHRGTLTVLAWMWLCGPALAVTAGIAFDRAAFWGGLVFATPSMLVSLAASRMEL